jgi:hypothetical protein
MFVAIFDVGVGEGIQRKLYFFVVDGKDETSFGGSPQESVERLF